MSDLREAIAAAVPSATLLNEEIAAIEAVVEAYLRAHDAPADWDAFVVRVWQETVRFIPLADRDLAWEAFHQASEERAPLADSGCAFCHRPTVDRLCDKCWEAAKAQERDKERERIRQRIEALPGVITGMEYVHGVREGNSAIVMRADVLEALGGSDE